MLYEILEYPRMYPRCFLELISCGHQVNSSIWKNRCIHFKENDNTQFPAANDDNKASDASLIDGPEKAAVAAAAYHVTYRASCNEAAAAVRETVGHLLLTLQEHYHSADCHKTTYSTPDDHQGVKYTTQCVKHTPRYQKQM